MDSFIDPDDPDDKPKTKYVDSALPSDIESADDLEAAVAKLTPRSEVQQIFSDVFTALGNKKEARVQAIREQASSGATLNEADAFLYTGIERVQTPPVQPHHHQLVGRQPDSVMCASGKVSIVVAGDCVGYNEVTLNIAR